MLADLSLLVLAAACLGYYFREELPTPFDVGEKLGIQPRHLHAMGIGHEILFTAEELSSFKGEDGGKIYLAVIVEVFDVTAGPLYYGPEGGYRGFAGKDGSKAFVTGHFNETGLIPDCSELTPGQCKDILSWRDFYRDEEKYFYLGKLIGFYYDENGKPTPEHAKFYGRVDEAEAIKAAEDKLSAEFPGCNSRWSQAEGGEVWCTVKSGGVDRAWVGFPRMWTRKDPGTGKMSKKCVCIQESTGGPHGAEGMFEVYEGCEATAVRCKT
jgi:predicted heme/steroid binding protein